MSTIASAPASARGLAGSSWQRRLAVGLRRWWLAWMSARLEQAAIVQLAALSDRELKDIGLHRDEIVSAVKAGAIRDRTASRYRRRAGSARRP